MTMSKKFFLATFFALLAASPMYAGINPQALEILDKTSSLYKNKGDMQLEMNIVFKDEKTKSEKSAKGTLKTQGRKFLMDTEFAEMLFDGKYMYVYASDAGELTITEPDHEEMSGMDPTAILELYKKNFKVEAPETVKKNGKNLYSIDLFPENLNTEFFKLNITVNQNDYSIYSVSTYAKNGVTNTIEINKTSVGQNFPEDMFVFNKAKYPDAILIDLR